MQIKRFFVRALIALFAVTLPNLALAQSNTNVWFKGSSNNVPVSSTDPLPVTTASGSPVLTSQNPWTAVTGTQTALSIATATAPTVPATATILVAQAQGTNNASAQCLFWRDDGTNPTGSAGQFLGAGSTLVYKVSSTPIKFIQATSATCTVTIAYYRDS